MNNRQRQMIKEAYEAGYRSGLNEQSSDGREFERYVLQLLKYGIDFAHNQRRTRLKRSGKYTPDFRRRNYFGQVKPTDMTPSTINPYDPRMGSGPQA